MTGQEAFRKVKQGEKVRLKIWPAGEHLHYDATEGLKNQAGGKSTLEFVLSCLQFVGEWEIYKEGTLTTPGEIITALARGEVVYLENDSAFRVGYRLSGGQLESNGYPNDDGCWRKLDAIAFCTGTGRYFVKPGGL